MKLVKWNMDYDMEFDIVGYSIYPEERYNEIVIHNTRTLEEFFKNKTPRVTGKPSPTSVLELGNGTNAFIEIGSPEDFYEQFTVTDITEEESVILSKLLGESFGVGYKMFEL